jgi:hypothetical protein
MASHREPAAPTSRLIQGSQVHRVDERVSIRPAATPAPGAPIVDLIRDGRNIREIRITCQCGQRHILECEYE